MRIERKKINFRDARGTITDIFTGDSKDHSTLIVSKKGAVRGNHLHKKSIQYTFVVAGQMTMYSRKPKGGKVYKHILKPNDLMTHERSEAHAMRADKDTIFLAFADGLRGGKDYERDTYRLETSLIDLWKRQSRSSRRGKR